MQEIIMKQVASKVMLGLPGNSEDGMFLRNVG
jgi:hypothetical protein